MGTKPRMITKRENERKGLYYQSEHVFFEDGKWVVCFLRRGKRENVAVFDDEIAANAEIVRRITQHYWWYETVQKLKEIG